MHFKPDVAAFAKSIASNLYIARKRRGLTQAQLAKLAGVRTATICQAENNPSHMQLDTLQKILDALGLRLTFVER